MTIKCCTEFGSCCKNCTASYDAEGNYYNCNCNWWERLQLVPQAFIVDAEHFDDATRTLKPGAGFEVTPLMRMLKCETTGYYQYECITCQNRFDEPFAHQKCEVIEKKKQEQKKCAWLMPLMPSCQNAAVGDAVFCESHIWKIERPRWDV